MGVFRVWWRAWRAYFPPRGLMNDFDGTGRFRASLFHPATRTKSGSQILRMCCQNWLLITIIFLSPTHTSTITLGVILPTIQIYMFMSWERHILHVSPVDVEVVSEMPAGCLAYKLFLLNWNPVDQSFHPHIYAYFLNCDVYLSERLPNFLRFIFRFCEWSYLAEYVTGAGYNFLRCILQLGHLVLKHIASFYNAETYQAL